MAKKSLWGFYDGEPFMENPHLVVLNPKRKKGRSMAKRSSRSRMAWVRSFRRRKNPKRHGTVAVIRATSNPRRRHHRRRRNPVGLPMLMNRRRRYSRNPSVMGFQLPDFKSVLYVGAGFMATPMVESQINRFMPASITGTPWGRYAVKIGSVVALTLVAKQVLGGEAAKRVAIGGGTYVLVAAINDFAPSLTGGVGAYSRSTPLAAYSSYRQRSLGAYTTAGAMSNSYGAQSVGVSRGR